MTFDTFISRFSGFNGATRIWPAACHFGRRYQTAQAARPVVFMRIPKTSSSSVRTGLRTMLAPATVLDGFDLSLFGAYRDFDTLDDELRSAIFDPPTSPLPPQPAQEPVPK